MVLSVLVALVPPNVRGFGYGDVAEVSIGHTFAIIHFIIPLTIFRP
jgi:hypothetical protein